MKDELITKGQAIKQIQKYGVGCFDADEFIPEQAERFVINKIKEIQPKTGRWIIEGDVGNGNRYCHCSECGRGDTQAITQRVPYCWWCGSYNGGEE